MTMAESIQTWLASRHGIDKDDTITINAPSSLRSVGYADLTLEKASPQHQDNVVFLNEPWTELCHLVTWTNQLVTMMRNYKQSLIALELMRGGKEFPISLASFHVDEAIAVVTSALNFDVGLDFHHPETKGNTYAVSCVAIDDSTTITDLITQVLSCLYAKCLVRLIVKSSQFYSSVMSAYIVDMMYKSGATENEIKCLSIERRDSQVIWKYLKATSSNRDSKLSIVATVFKQTDTFAASQGIIEAYFREQYPNLIVLVEESAYERFIRDWQRYYSHAVQIGSRLDERTTVVDSFNSKISIDLAAIDIKQSHKMAGHVINVLKFRTIDELMSLLGNLRKIPYISVWNDDILLSREFCLRVNQCSEFWINHVPRSMARKKFTEEMVNFHHDIYANDMTNIYNSLYNQFSDEVEQLRKVQSSFQKKDTRLRNSLIIHAYVSLMTKCKSLKNGATVGESVWRLKKFQWGALQKSNQCESSHSRVESISKPVGLALLLVKEESTIKSKALLVEVIFKNLLLGNGVLLICPPNTLGAKFALENDHIIPFKMLHGPVPDISRLSLEESEELSETLGNKKQCPRNTYAIEITQDTSSDTYETHIVTLGSRRKMIWYPNADVTNYWSNEA